MAPPPDWLIKWILTGCAVLAVAAVLATRAYRERERAREQECQARRGVYVYLGGSRRGNCMAPELFR